MHKCLKVLGAMDYMMDFNLIYADIITRPRGEYIVHVGYALNKRMLVLSGPTLNVWTPKNKSIRIINDITAEFPPNDRLIENNKFPKVGNIPLKNVIEHLSEFMA